MYIGVIRMKTQYLATSAVKANLPMSAMRELTLEETLVCSGGDNPGMGNYDGKEDQSLPANCEWINGGDRISCVFAAPQ
jgi:hypothetical protein